LVHASTPKNLPVLKAHSWCRSLLVLSRH
jgi:hypothetical protein